MKTTIEDLRERKVTTTGELINKLKKFPPNTKVASCGADSGGYDVCFNDYCGVSIYSDADGDVVVINHLEYEAEKAYENKKITKEELKEFEK